MMVLWLAGCLMQTPPGSPLTSAPYRSDAASLRDEVLRLIPPGTSLSAANTVMAALDFNCLTEEGVTVLFGPDQAGASRVVESPRLSCGREDAGFLMLRRHLSVYIERLDEQTGEVFAQVNVHAMI